MCSREVKHQSSRGIFLFSVVCSRFEENSSIKTWEENLGKKSVVDLTFSLPLFALSLVSIIVHGCALLPIAPCGCALLLLMTKLELIYFFSIVCKFVAMVMASVAIVVANFTIVQ
jgi:hypothetical protein